MFTIYIYNYCIVSINFDSVLLHALSYIGIIINLKYICPYRGGAGIMQI